MDKFHMTVPVDLWNELTKQNKSLLADMAEIVEVIVGETGGLMMRLDLIKKIASKHTKKT